MTVEEAIIERIEAIAAVTDIVGTRIYKARLPMRPKLPAIRVDAVSELRDAHLRGINTLRRSRVQVDCTSGESDSGDPDHDAEVLANLVEGPGDGTGLAGGQGLSTGSPSIQITAIFPANKMERYEPDEVRQSTISRDYWVWWRHA
jgi:hypothetical protein